MKYLLLTLACASTCHASVSRGRGDTYHVDNMGSSYQVNDTHEKLNSIQFVDSSSIQPTTKFKTPTAIY